MFYKVLVLGSFTVINKNVKFYSFCLPRETLHQEMEINKHEYKTTGAKILFYFETGFQDNKEGLLLIVFLFKVTPKQLLVKVEHLKIFKYSYFDGSSQ